MDRLSNVNNIAAFVTVAREGSVSRAAEVLNLTQPAVSHQIRRLSEETGLRLFARTATGVRITDDGEAMLAKAEQVLAALTDFHRTAGQRTGRLSGLLKIGTVVDPEFIRLGQLLARLRADHPEVKTELLHGVSGDVIGWLRRGLIDAGYVLGGADGVAGMEADGETRIRTIRLAAFSYRVIAPAGWEARIQAADWPALADLPWIGTPESSAHNRLLAGIFERRGLRPNVVALVDQEASMLEMVRSGIGLSLCRESIALHQKQAFGLAVADAVSVPATLCFAALDRRADDPILAQTFDLLRRIW
ncbi:LysR family transcriptional regulator [Jannaschia sp. 2305UL9-9]|uniref:LysR family transcriptional regulator n=1 Tax=Jannaschia sp. 2305UL9-9 TaxID=3121638 RepID=UPI003529A984